MNDMPLHPVVVHLPLALAVLLPLLALGAAVAIAKKKVPPKIWAAVLGLQLLMVGSGIVAMQSGERDEERVEAVVPEAAIEAHEEAAERFVWASAAITLLFALGLGWPKPEWRNAAMGASVAGAAVAAVLALSVGHAGGELVYRHGAAAAHVSRTASAPAEAGAPALPQYGQERGEDEEEDDDD